MVVSDLGNFPTLYVSYWLILCKFVGIFTSMLFSPSYLLPWRKDFHGPALFIELFAYFAEYCLFAMV